MNDQTIIRSPHDSERPYVSTCRATAQDERLSWEARGILWYLLSKPDNWQVVIPDLMQNCGRDKVRNTLAELIRFGYLEKPEKQPHGEAGHFTSPDYRVHEVPLTEKPLTVKPSTAKPTLHNKEVHSTECTTTSSDRSNIFTLYEQNIGMLTPLIGDALKEIEAEYPAGWFEDAVKEAVLNNKRNLRYIEAILKRWQAEGKDSGKKTSQAQPSPAPDPWGVTSD